MHRFSSISAIVLSLTLICITNVQADPAKLYEITGSTSGEAFGSGLACIPKFSSPSQGSDVAVGSPDFPSSQSGRVQIFDGLSSNVLLSDSGNANERLGSAVSSTLEDISLTPDGIPDIIAGKNSTAFGTPFATIYYSPDGESSATIFAIGLSTTGTPSGFGYAIIPLGHKKVAISAPFFEQSSGNCGSPSTNCGGVEVFDLSAPPYSTSLGVYIDSGNGLRLAPH